MSSRLQLCNQIASSRFRAGHGNGRSCTQAGTTIRAIIEEFRVIVAVVGTDSQRGRTSFIYQYCIRSIMRMLITGCHACFHPIELYLLSFGERTSAFGWLIRSSARYQCYACIDNVRPIEVGSCYWQTSPYDRGEAMAFGIKFSRSYKEAWCNCHRSIKWSCF